MTFWSNFSLVLFGKRREIHRTTLTNLCINWDNITKSICQFWQDHNNNFDKSNNWNKNKQEHGMTEWQGKVMIWLGSDKNILSLFFCSTAGWPIWLFRQWDSEGNLKVWWTPATDEKCVWLFLEKSISFKITIRFLSKAKCIIDLYNNFTVTELGNNVTVNGIATQVWLCSKEKIHF